MNSGKSLKAKQLSAIQLLALGTPANRVAEQLAVSAMTIYRWRRLPEFDAKLTSIANSGLEEIAKKMNATALTAVETLQEVLCDLSQPTPLRVRAALGVLGAMPSVNGALERGLQHRFADFDLEQRFSDVVYPHDNGGIAGASTGNCVTV